MQRRGRAHWLFLAPATLHLAVFALIPILYALYLSFFRANLIKDEKVFTGIRNYQLAFTDESFWNALWNSAVFAALSVPFGMMVALAVALLVAQRLKGMAIFRTIFYIPAITSVLSISMLWIYIYLPEKGAINMLLGALGVTNTTDFLNNSAYAMPALIFMSAWTGLGPRMVIFLAGLMGIPPTLYEAASLDGASNWRQFWSVTLPMLGPTTFFVAVTSTISAFQIFTPVYMMTKGGPDGATDVVGYHIYTEAWMNFHTGLASAKSFILLAAIAAVALVQIRLMRTQMSGHGT